MGYTLERWLPVHGWKGLYEVSDLGRVRSLDRMDARDRNQLRGRVLRPSVCRKGYHRVMLRKGGRSPRFLVHRLVLEMFHSQCPEGMECDHINADTFDNRLCNLRWVTPAQNAQHRVALGRHADARGEMHGQSKLTDAMIVEIRARAMGPETQAAIARDFDVGPSVISRIASRIAWGHVAEEVF